MTRKLWILAIALCLAAIPHVSGNIGGSNQEAYYGMNDTTTTDKFIDASGNNRDADIISGNYTTTNCIEGSAAFDVSNSHTEGAEAPPLFKGSSSDWSISFWYNMTKPTGGDNFSGALERLWDARGSGGTAEVNLQVRNSDDSDQTNDNLKFFVKDDGGDAIDVTLDRPANDEWVHVYTEFDGSENRITMRLNDTTEADVADSKVGASNLDVEGQLHVGFSDGEQNGLPAVIDEFYFYNRTLTSQEITDHFNSFNDDGSCGSDGGNDGDPASGSTLNATKSAWLADPPLYEGGSEEICLADHVNVTTSPTYNVSFEDSHPRIGNRSFTNQESFPDSRCVSPDLTGHGNGWVWVSVKNETGSRLHGFWYVQDGTHISNFGGPHLLELGIWGSIMAASFWAGYLAVPAITLLPAIGVPFRAVGVDWAVGFEAGVFLVLLVAFLEFIAKKFSLGTDNNVPGK